MSIDDDRNEARPRRPDDDEPPPRHRRDDYGDRPPRRPPPPPPVEATDFLIPTGVSGYSIAACYLGLIGCFLPILGVVLGPIAIVCGIVALRRRKKAATYGAVTSDIRAVLGIIFGGLTLVGLLVFFIAILAGAFASQ